MKRILIIGMHDKIGGVETFFMNYYRNIDKNKIQFDFINMFKELCFENEIIELGGKIYKVPNVKINPIKYYNELKKIIKSNKYEIIHINMLSMANVMPIIAARNAGAKRIIVHSHNTNTPQGALRKILNKLNKKIVLKNATDLFACSEAAGRWMFGKNKKFTVIKNAIDIEKFKYDEQKRKEIRKKLNIENKFVIGHVGRFSEQKNHEFLIDVYQQVLKKGKNTVLLLIGEGELKKNIIEKVKNIGIEQNVIFLGTTNKISDYYQAMDLFVLPSKFEGLPVVGVEVQTNGLPCIFSENITEEMKITDNVTFLKIENAEDWADCILKLERNSKRKDETEKIREKGYDIICEANRLEKIYLEDIK